MENMNMNERIIAVAKEYADGYDFDGDIIITEKGENIMISYANIDEVYRRFLETDSDLDCGTVVAKLATIAALAPEEYEEALKAFVKLQGAKLALKLGFAYASMDIALFEQMFKGTFSNATEKAKAKAAYLRKIDRRKGRRISYDDFENMIWETRCLGRDYDLMSDFERKVFDKIMEESIIVGSTNFASGFHEEIEEELRRMEADYWADKSF